MQLPDFAPIPPEAWVSLARLHQIAVSQITPLPEIGITNKLYRLGDHLMLRVPRHHPHLISLAHKEAKVVPAARAAGVHTPAILLFDDSCTLLPVPYTLLSGHLGKRWGCSIWSQKRRQRSGGRWAEIWRGSIAPLLQSWSHQKRWASAMICALRQKHWLTPDSLL